MTTPRFVDPVTNESIEQDWQYVIWVDVIPGEYEEPEGEADEGGDEEGD